MNHSWFMLHKWMINFVWKKNLKGIERKVRQPWQSPHECQHANEVWWRRPQLKSSNSKSESPNFLIVSQTVKCKSLYSKNLVFWNFQSTWYSCSIFFSIVFTLLSQPKGNFEFPEDSWFWIHRNSNIEFFQCHLTFARPQQYTFQVDIPNRRKKQQLFFFLM